MANNADVTYILTGSEKDCSLLEEAARQIMNMPQYPGWLGYMNCFIYPEQRPLYTFCNWTNDRESAQYPFWDCRGTIEDVQPVCPLDDSVERDEGLTHFVTLHCDEAWIAHSEIVHYFARKFNCRMNYMCVESGRQVYELHDPDHVFNNAKWFVNMNCTGEEKLYQDMSVEGLKDDPDQIWPAQFLKYLKENAITLTENNFCEVIDAFNNYLQEIDKSGKLSASAGEFFHDTWDDFEDEVPSLESVIEKNIQENERNNTPR